jgi:hypothetical protein
VAQIAPEAERYYRPGETEAERDDRNLIELLQELRVAGLGIQMIFGFLLALPFTSRFSALGHGQRVLYMVTLVLAAVATALLVGPVAYHRLVFRLHLKGHLVRAANILAILGLATVALTVCAALLLVASYVARGLPAALIAVFVFGLFASLWFVFPLSRRWGSPSEPPGRPGGRPAEAGPPAPGSRGSPPVRPGSAS